MSRLRIAVIPVLATLLLSGCNRGDDPTIDATGPAADSFSAKLMDADGNQTGMVEMAFSTDGATLTVTATGLPPGLHGLHVHKTGLCEPDSADPATPGKRGAFLSAGGHLAQEGQTHGDHDGDLPSLLVRADGTARLVVSTDRLTRDKVLDEDGSALMVHADEDNFANVPERYTETPDETTTKTGDAGARLACAALTD